MVFHTTFHLRTFRLVTEAEMFCMENICSTTWPWPSSKQASYGMEEVVAPVHSTSQDLPPLSQSILNALLLKRTLEGLLSKHWHAQLQWLRLPRNAIPHIKAFPEQHGEPFSIAHRWGYCLLWFNNMHCYGNKMLFALVHKLQQATDTC